MLSVSVLLLDRLFLFLFASKLESTELLDEDGGCLSSDADRKIFEEKFGHKKAKNSTTQDIVKIGNRKPETVYEIRICSFLFIKTFWSAIYQCGCCVICSMLIASLQQSTKVESHSESQSGSSACQI